MKYKIHYDKENDCLIGKFTGALDKETVRKYGENAAKLSLKHICKQLISDISGVQIELSTIELFELPSLMELAGIDRTWKRVVLIGSDESGADPHFFENVALNRGYNVKVCTDFDEAINWLKSEQ